MYRAKAQCHVVIAPNLYAHAAAAKLRKKSPGKQDVSADIVLHIEHCLMAASPRSDGGGNVSVTAATQSCLIAESRP